MPAFGHRRLHVLHVHGGDSSLSSARCFLSMCALGGSSLSWTRGLYSCTCFVIVICVVYSFTWAFICSMSTPLCRTNIICAVPLPVRSAILLIHVLSLSSGRLVFPPQIVYSRPPLSLPHTSASPVPLLSSLRCFLLVLNFFEYTEILRIIAQLALKIKHFPPLNRNLSVQVACPNVGVHFSVGT